MEKFKSNKRKIGLLGGTFDPIHLGHINNATLAYKQLELDEVWLVPVLNNPFNKNIIASPQQRIEMINLAIKDYPYISLCDIELKASPEKKSYTIDTIRHLKSLYPFDFYFIIGYDQVVNFNMWKSASDLASEVQLVAIQRLGYEKSFNIDKYNMIELLCTPNDISSTNIRLGKCLEVNPNVMNYMVMNSIYTKTMIQPYMSKKRYLHTLSVALLAYDFAKSNHVEPNKAYIAGLFHDIAKEMNQEEMIKIMKVHFPQFLHYSQAVMHQWVSAFIAKEVFKIKDKEILQAIENHTTGSINMSKLDMCVYCADKYDPTRGFDSSKEISKCKENIVEGFKYALTDFYEFSKKNNRKIDKIFYDIYNKYVMEE